MSNIENEHFIERSRPTDSAYSFGILVSIVKWMEKKGIYRFTIKIPFLMTRILTFLIGSILFKMGPWKKKVSKNVDLIFRNKLERKYGLKITKKIKNYIAFLNARNTVRTFIDDFFFFPAFAGYKELCKKYIYIEDGLKRIEEAWKQGKGVVMMSLHAGAFIIIASALGYFKKVRKFPVIPYIAVEVGSMDAYIDYMRKSIHVLDLEQGEKVDRKTQLFDVIKRKKGIIMLGVDRGHENYPKFPMFGKKALCPMGPAQLAAKYGTLVMPAITVPHPKKKIFLGEAWEPLKLKSKADYPEVPERKLVEENAFIINKAIEKMIIKQYPSWLYLMLFDKLKKIE